MRFVVVGFLVLFLASGLYGCGRDKGSAKSDAGELEQAFGLISGAPPSQESTPEAVASRAVEALRAQDWPRALSLLEWMRVYAKLTPDQARVVQKVSGKVYIRISELAANGNAEAKAALDRARKEAERR